MIDNFTKEDLMNEKWRDIAGYDGLYQVSDIGRVRSLKFGKVMVLRPYKRRDGYLSVDLWKDGRKKNFLVHRLVAQAFIKNDDETKNEINHIDECKQNNKVSNLEYCDRSYNLTYNDLQFRRKGGVQRKITKLYDQNLSITKNLETFRANGVECCRTTLWKLRKDLGLTRDYRPRKKRH